MSFDLFYTFSMTSKTKQKQPTFQAVLSSQACKSVPCHVRLAVDFLLLYPVEWGVLYPVEWGVLYPVEWGVFYPVEWGVRLLENPPPAPPSVEFLYLGPALPGRCRFSTF